MVQIQVSITVIVYLYVVPENVRLFEKMVLTARPLHLLEGVSKIS